MRNRSGAVRLPPRSLAVVALVALALGSAIAGAAVDRVLIRSRGFTLVLPDTGFHPLSSVLRSPTDEQRRQRRTQLATELGLNTAQAATVDSILDAHAAEFRQLREDIRPRVEQLTQSVRQDVERTLTPSQRDRYRALLGVQTDDELTAKRPPQ